MSTTRTADPRTVAETYVACWRRADFTDLRPYLHPEVAFDGVLGSTRGVDDFIEGVTGLARVTTALEVRARLADESDVMTWFRLEVDGASTEVVNWTHLDDGLVTQTRVTFDPRPLLGPVD